VGLFGGSLEEDTKGLGWVLMKNDWKLEVQRCHLLYRITREEQVTYLVVVGQWPSEKLRAQFLPPPRLLHSLINRYNTTVTSGGELSILDIAYELAPAMMKKGLLQLLAIVVFSACAIFDSVV
jgi:hypothetical protein